MPNVLVITNNLNNRTETFIKNFIFELDSLENVNLSVYQRSKTANDVQKINVGTLCKLSFISSIKDKYLGSWDSQLDRLNRLGITFDNLSNVDFVVVDYAVNAVEIFKNVNRLYVPVFVFVHGYDVSKSFRNKNFVNLFNELSKKDNVFFVSPCRFFINKLMVNFSLDIKKLILLPYGVTNSNTDFLLNIPLDSMFRLLFVGRFVEKKNPLVLVEVVRVLVNEMGILNFELILIGDGPLFECVRSKIDSYNLHSHIRLRGSLSHSKVLELMSKVHIYVQHSVTDFDGDQEGLPNSILEAISAGLPVISTIHSGIPEIVENGKTGFLVQEFDYVGMAEKLALLLSDMELYTNMRKNIMEYRKRKLWSNSKRVKTFLSIVRSV